MILIGYASKYGATQEIAEYVGKQLQAAGREVDVRPVAGIADLGEPEAVIVGSGLYQGAWLPEATEFVRNNQAALAQVPTWLFSVGPLGTDVKDDEEQPVEIAEFRGQIGPRHHAVFYGALDHSKLDRSDRMTMKAAGAPEGDFRDWDAVAAWVADISP